MPVAEPAPPLPPLPPLPATLPLFPLAGSLLLPGNWLPLNIFEPRYRNMVEDAMRSERWIGMIQPLAPQQDDWPAIEPPAANPRLYAVGCAGRIESCEPQADGRYHILLKGFSRFRVRQELARERGYRRAVADYAEFAADLLEPAAELDPAPLLGALRTFGKAQGLSFDLDVLAALPGVALLNGLAVALPFQPAEKQALLEAAGLAQRHQMLLTLMGMGVDPAAGDRYAPPTVH
jgi:Lon protease-like protein